MRNRLVVIFGIALSALLLWLLFRNADLAEMGAALRGVHWGWYGAAIASVLVSFVTRVWRWRYIVRAAAPASFRALFSATQIGFLGNFVLPGRAGELIRALVLTRLARIPFAKSLAFAALDRVSDLFGLLVAMLITVFTFHPSETIAPAVQMDIPDKLTALLEPGAIRGLIWMMAAGLVAIIGAMLLLYVKQDLALRLSGRLIGIVSRRLAEKVHEILRNFAEGMHVLRSYGDLVKALTVSLITWGLFAVGHQCVFRAFGIFMPWHLTALFVVILAVAVSVPGPPGFIGPFHWAVVIGLAVAAPATDPDRAKAVAVALHLANLIPVVAVGLVCLYFEKFGLIQLRRESEAAEATLEEGA